jgi:tetratricopeptide (TPR) repeat protein
MVNVTDHLASLGAIFHHDGCINLSCRIGDYAAPTALSQLVLKHFDALPREDRQLLEVASVRGMTFSSALVTLALNEPIELIERRCDALAKRELFIRRQGSVRWPDGTSGSRYGFIHSLYQNVLYDRLSDAKKKRLHRLVGDRLEKAYGGETEPIAAELANHFERAGHYDRALRYLLQATQKAVRQSACQEAIDYAIKRSRLAELLPESPERIGIRLNLQLVLAVATCTSKGHATEETKNAFACSRDVARYVRNDTLSFQSLAGVFSFHWLRGELRMAFHRAEELLELAEHTRGKVFLLNAHMALAASLFYQGKIDLAHKRLERALRHYDLEYHRSMRPLFAWDPGVVVHCYHAQALWFLGFSQRAEKTGQAALILVKKLGSPFNGAIFYGIHSMYYAYRDDALKTLETAEAALRVSTSGGFLRCLAIGTLVKGWALRELKNASEGLNLLLDGIERWKSTGAEMGMPTYIELLADAYQRAGKFKEAFDAVEVGLTISARNNDCHYDAGLYRRKGELLMKKTGKSINGSDDPVDCFLRAVSIAHRQEARSLELRATFSLARL